MRFKYRRQSDVEANEDRVSHGGHHDVPNGMGDAWDCCRTKEAVPKPQDKLAIAKGEARQLLLIIDTDKKGKISKQEWMKFMEGEFDRLDKTKSGELDVKELMQSKLRVSHFSSVGK
jgi:hypothetical protein